MKKLILFLMTMWMVACSAPIPGEEVTREDVGEVQEALIPSCSIVGEAGVANATYITAIRIVDSVGAKLDIDYLDPVTNVRDTARITFKDVHFYPFHSTNGTAWTAQNNANPLRRITFKAPGCELNFPDSYCLWMQGDLDFGDHVNFFQNTEVFLVDRQIFPVSTTFDTGAGQITAPYGYGISRIAGMGTSPANTLKVSARSSLGVSNKSFKFETSGCPFP